MDSPELTTSQKQAASFLLDIGYLDIEITTSRLIPTSHAKSTVSNRFALLNLTSRCRDFFPLFSPDIEHIHFFGTLLTPSYFGLTKHPETFHGSNGKGLNAQQAFETCMGETAEFLSFLRQERDPLVMRHTAKMKGEQEEQEWINGILGRESDPSGKLDECVEVQSCGHKGSFLMPAELVLRSPRTSNNARNPALSNGVGAGRNQEEALLSGILELVERDATA
ncbi:MAG: YcaO-like family protein, partial [Sneathiellales bacterium]|nr:YcaO-like family protein [Sneathiellales bacterium]